MYLTFLDGSHIRLFEKIDENGNGYLSAAELRALITGIRFDEIDLDKDDAVEKVMKDFDTITPDSQVDLGEFLAGISRWLNEAKRSGNISTTDPGHRTMKYLNDFQVVSSADVDL